MPDADRRGQRSREKSVRRVGLFGHGLVDQQTTTNVARDTHSNPKPFRNPASRMVAASEGGDHLLAHQAFVWVNRVGKGQLAAGAREPPTRTQVLITATPHPSGNPGTGPK